MGSSSTSTSAPCASARAISASWRSPPEISVIGTMREARDADALERIARPAHGRAAAGCANQPMFAARPISTASVTVNANAVGLLLRHVREEACARGAAACRATSSPSTRREPASGAQQAQQRAEQRGLAATVAAQHREHFARAAQREIDAAADDAAP